MSYACDWEVRKDISKDVPSVPLLRKGVKLHRRTSLGKFPAWRARTERHSHLEEVSPAFGLGGMWAGLAGIEATESILRPGGHYRFSGATGGGNGVKSVRPELPKELSFHGGQTLRQQGSFPVSGSPPQKVFYNRESEHVSRKYPALSPCLCVHWSINTPRQALAGASVPRGHLDQPAPELPSSQQQFPHPADWGWGQET